MKRDAARLSGVLTGFTLSTLFARSCMHCRGAWTGQNLFPAPQEPVLGSFPAGSSGDEALMATAMQSDSLVKDGAGIDCDGGAGAGFTPRARR